jgi:hypothetical protein
MRKIFMVTLLAVQMMLPLTVKADDSVFSLAQMVVAAGVGNREPVGVADSFSAEIGRVYCFIEARDVQRETPIRTIWYFEEEEVASARLLLGQGARWRTFSSVNIGDQQGNWRVDLLDEADQVVHSIDFRVE